MILFSPAKINIGLRIIERREDGYHNLQSVMVPVGLFDLLEIRTDDAHSHGLHFRQTGIPVEAGSGKNLCERAFELMAHEITLPPVQIHLHKQIPVGAGLGGGSSNASYTLKGLSRITNNGISPERLHQLASRLGSDCPFFLHHQPMLMEGRGEILSPSSVNLEGHHLVLLFPGIPISTAEAYAAVRPSSSGFDLGQLPARPPDQWRGLVVNDFEKEIFRLYPLLEDLKTGLYNAGANYASMSGSGSSVYGIFHHVPRLPAGLEKYVIWKGKADLPSAVS
jgi:4-diphosphocytidyl-2-C-methyl-D-erythritol kinase